MSSTTSNDSAPAAPALAPRSLSRRAFLKLSALTGVAAFAPFPLTAPLRIAATHPIAAPHHFITNPDSLLAESLRAYDVLLAPAYIATTLIARDQVLPLPATLLRQRLRPHDPDGAFTRPHAHTYFTRAPRHWPRLAVALALQQRGHSPNSRHLGHLLQALEDVVNNADVTRPAAPVWIELDWLIMRDTLHATAAATFLAACPVAETPRSTSAIPLMPWPPTIHTHLMARWS